MVVLAERLVDCDQMGIFEVEGDHIVAWRDYFDVRASETWATS